MNFIKQHVVGFLNRYRLGKNISKDSYFNKTAQLSSLELLKSPRRTAIINYFITLLDAKYYLEIGVRDPKKNFDRILCNNKYSVDPGIEFLDNPVDFKMSSDVFFKKLKNSDLELNSNTKFDVIFIDGLHISHQVDRDILNSLEYLKDNGVIILHDCNPPSEFHQRESYDFMYSPARNFWNGTTWKAFYKFRHQNDLFSICFDADWGVGIISRKKHPFFNNIEAKVQNEFYEFSVLNKFRKEHLNLCSFEKWTELIEK
ncbi:MAG: class I SAM-dependent methyltransferase [Xanthomarina gelatinilytica]|uniref:class I SAM-dependent methyltransferase n=1 Tax=Xanthomarina gelatinilytica TaxID=1137281 RepID=UPI003A8B3313